MIQLKLSKTYYAKIKRIKRLPRLVSETMEANARKDAVGVVEEYKNGIRKNNFSLEKLKPETIQRKKRKGYPKPATPLYGLGDAGSPRSLIDALYIRRLKTAYKIMISKRKHHSGKVSLELLFRVHENGTVIKTRTALIRIPPRPAFKKAFERHMRKKSAGEPTREVRRAINEYIKKSSRIRFDRMIQVETDWRRYAEGS